MVKRNRKRTISDERDQARFGAKARLGCVIAPDAFAWGEAEDSATLRASWRARRF
jgi:hypothetical protein